jgi:hypothetical protein
MFERIWFSYHTGSNRKYSRVDSIKKDTEVKKFLGVARA